jgi:hypothetical protein
MDDFQFWLYVIIGVIYLISQVRKKSKAGQELPPERPQPRQKTKPQTSWKSEEVSSAPSPKPITFEELLKEITASKEKPVAETQSYEEYQPEYEDYDDRVEDEIKDIEEEAVTNPQKNSIYQQFEEAKYKDYTKDTLEESLKLANVNMKYGRFKEFESSKEVNLLEAYASDLRNPEGLKKAFVLSEIFNRKEF